MLKKYKIRFAFVFCVSYALVYGMENEIPSCNEMVMKVLRPIFSYFGATIDEKGRIIFDEEIDGRDIWSIKEVEYYYNELKVDVHFKNGYIRSFPNGLLSFQAKLLHSIPNNFDQVVDERGKHPFYLRMSYDNSPILKSQQYFIKRK
jgi:hypothetical protein